MKKLFGMIAIILFLSSVVFAGSKLTQRTSIQDDKFAIYEICTSGYKFVIVRSKDKRDIPGAGGITAGLTITQFYENKNGNTVPAKC